MNDTKCYQKLKSLFKYGKKYYKMKKKFFIIIIRNFFRLENLVYYLEVFLKEYKYILKSHDLQSPFD